MSDVSTWSVTANANNAASPNGFPENMPPSGVNDSCREVMAAVKRADTENAKLAGATFTGLVNLAAGADIASAATIDLTAATGNFPRITGTTPTSAVTMNTGQQMLVVADGAWPLTYHATTNKINTGGANYTCAAGDVIFYHKDLSGVVHGRISRSLEGNSVGVDVRWFGAVGDGTTDDTTAIQSAINFCQENNKVLFFPPNNKSAYYKITSALQITKPLVVVGAGSRLVTIGGLLSAGTYAIDMDGTVFGTYEQGKISGITLMPGAGANALRVKNVSNSIFTDIGLRDCVKGIVYTGTRCFSNLFEKIITISGISGASISMEGHTGGGQHSFRECSLGGATGFSLASSTVTDSVAFYNTNFEQCTSNSFYCNGSVSGLSFFGCRTEGCDGIDFNIDPSTGNAVTGLVVHGTTFGASDSGAVARIYLGGSGGKVRGFDISGNTVSHGTHAFSGVLVNLNGEGESGTVASNWLDGTIAACAPTNVRRPNVAIFNNEGNNGKFVGNSFTLERGTWTPVDASGAALTFTSAGGKYHRIGEEIHWWAEIVFPDTANASGTLIGGLPYNVDNSVTTVMRAGASVDTTNSTIVQWVMQGPGTAATFRLEKAGQIVATNAECSGKSFYVSGRYTTSAG